VFRVSSLGISTRVLPNL